MKNQSHSYETSPAIWDHTVLPATQRKWTHSSITQSRCQRPGPGSGLAGGHVTVYGR